MHSYACVTKIMRVCTMKYFATPPWPEEADEVEEKGLGGSVMGGR